MVDGWCPRAGCGLAIRGRTPLGRGRERQSLRAARGYSTTLPGIHPTPRGRSALGGERVSSKIVKL